MIKISWDVEELVALIDIYRRNMSSSAKIDINSELQQLSIALNKRAELLGIIHDDKYRNLNGMKLMYQNVAYIATGGTQGMSSTSSSMRKIYGLLGRNGAGKTTLFNCLNEDLDIDAGEFYIVDNDTRKIESKDIGYVLSTPVVPEFLTGREFLKFFIDINKENISNLKSIDEYFDLIKIDADDRDKLMKDYSHGMKNKMQMLVHIIASPSILLLDEPLTSFDVVVAEEMKELLKKLKKGHILIFSTHIMELALDLCDEIVVLNKGVLESIDKNNLNNEKFKEKIIHVLKGEENDYDKEVS